MSANKISLGFILFFIVSLLVKQFVSLPDLINTILYFLRPISLVIAAVVGVVGIFSVNTSPSNNTNIKSNAISITVVLVSVGLLVMMAVFLLAVFAWKNS